MAYIIAEIGSNHNGSMATAVRLIEAAKKCGVDAVKFQSWTPTSLYAEEYLAQNPELFRDLQKYYLPIHNLKRLSLVAKKLDLDFICSVFSEEEADALESVVKSYKIASMDVNNIPLLKHIVKKRKPVIISMGMTTPDEIGHAVEILRKCPLTVMHCVSLYPCPLSKANLTRIDYYKRLLDNQAVNTGYSDHTEGIIAPVIAVAKGAYMIEKHFTLDRSQEGWDHAHSLDPKEMKQMVYAIREAELLLRYAPEQDLSSRQNMRRSLVSSKALKAGRRIGKGDIAFKRPGVGYGLQDNILKRVLCHDVAKGHVFTPEDFECERR